ncbi:unnamed protein product [Oikopleura dioica]|uniref:Uncharacterized protein n=1 Tax=Oikopleura dioica TaxID=34765 RepID=E4Y0F5_OIKDI|nr:unnamed protein product [Oikopleura dioica]
MFLPTPPRIKEPTLKIVSYLSRDFEKLKLFRIPTNTQNAYFEKKLIVDFVRRGLTIYRKAEVGDKRLVSLEQSRHHRELFIITIFNISFSDEGMYFTEFETENAKYRSELVNLYVNSIGPLMIEFAFFGAVVLSSGSATCR